jgi:hypothetical protein
MLGNAQNDGKFLLAVFAFILVCGHFNSPYSSAGDGFTRFLLPPVGEEGDGTPFAQSSAFVLS